VLSNKKKPRKASNLEKRFHAHKNFFSKDLKMQLLGEQLKPTTPSLGRIKSTAQTGLVCFQPPLATNGAPYATSTNGQKVILAFYEKKNKRNTIIDVEGMEF